MIIKEQLLLEHSKANTQKITRFIGTDKNRLQQLMDCFFSNEYRVTQRAAMAVSDCFDQHPFLMQSHLERMINNLDTQNLHIAVKRNTVRIFQFVEIKLDLQSKFYDHCINYLMDSKEPIAVKAFSMGILYNICKEHPDLKTEVIPLLEDELEHTESAGIRSRGRNILKKLSKL